MGNCTIFLAYLVDLIVGDPPQIPHPVIIIGKLISKLENIFYGDDKSNLYKLLTGGLLVSIVLLLSYGFTFTLIYLLNSVHPWLSWLASIWLISTTISAKGLKEIGFEIKQLLEKQNLPEARKKVGYIVGRDTENLDEKEITRATVETIAENIVDGITSPLFYAFIGGAPLAMTYRAVNTMDSMLGYKNDKYLYFGRIAARTDDVFNFIPARLTGLAIALVALLLPKFSGKQALKIFIRDSRNHPSPNSGYSESAVSGALKIRLGGTNYYQGQKSVRPYMGDAINELTYVMISKTITIMLATSCFWALIMTVLKVLGV